MVDLTQEQLEEVLTRVLDARKKIDDERHSAHHEYVARLIERDAKREEFKERVRQQVVGWGVIVALGGFLSTVGYAGYHWVIEIAQKGSGH